MAANDGGVEGGQQHTTLRSIAVNIFLKEGESNWKSSQKREKVVEPKYGATVTSSSSPFILFTIQLLKHLCVCVCVCNARMCVTYGGKGSRCMCPRNFVHVADFNLWVFDQDLGTPQSNIKPRFSGTNNHLFVYFFSNFSKHAAKICACCVCIKSQKTKSRTP